MKGIISKDHGNDSDDEDEDELQLKGTKTRSKQVLKPLFEDKKKNWKVMAPSHHHRPTLHFHISDRQVQVIRV